MHQGCGHIFLFLYDEHLPEQEKIAEKKMQHGKSELSQHATY